jgi:hypothetical protein
MTAVFVPSVLGLQNFYTRYLFIVVYAEEMALDGPESRLRAKQNPWIWTSPHILMGESKGFGD